MIAKAFAGPYVGLRAFGAQDRGLFFGRNREAHDVAALWQANRLTVLYGASGAGKTSLLHAGVIPRLDAAWTDIWPVGRVGPSPIKGSGNPFTLALLSCWSPAAEPEARTLGDFFAANPERADRYGDPMPTLIAIDQAEELFSDFPRLTEERAAFIAELAQALGDRPGLRLLLSLREDYLGAVLPHEAALGRGTRARFQLSPFDRPAALEATGRPLEGTKRQFAPGAAETLVDDLRTVTLTDATGAQTTVTVDTVEPVQLQVVCAALWESLPGNVRTITSWHVREHADVDRFLAGFCGRALAAVAREHNLPAAQIRGWLQRNLITELGTRGTAYEGLATTAGMPNAVVRSLEDHHILRAERRSGSRWYELQHDRLIEPLRQADPQEFLEGAAQVLADGDLAQAERQTRQAIRACGDDMRTQAKAERLLGEIAAVRGDLAEAQTRYRSAASLFEVLGDSSTVGEVLADVGRLSMRGGRPAAAVAELRAAIDRIPGDLTVRTDLALALWHAGHPQASLIVLNELLSIDGEPSAALRARGEILADESRAEAAKEALRDLDRVRRRQGAGTLAARALALAKLGRLEAAEQEAADALANAGDDGPVLLRVALVRALAGDAWRAKELAEQALAAGHPRLPPHLRDEAVRLAAAPPEQVPG